MTLPLLTYTPGGVILGGNKTQNFDPDITAFHALVAFGSFNQH